MRMTSTGAPPQMRLCKTNVDADSLQQHRAHGRPRPQIHTTIRAVNLARVHSRLPAAPEAPAFPTTAPDLTPTSETFQAATTRPTFKVTKKSRDAIPKRLKPKGASNIGEVLLERTARTIHKPGRHMTTTTIEAEMATPDMTTEAMSRVDTKCTDTCHGCTHDFTNFPSHALSRNTPIV